MKELRVLIESLAPVGEEQLSAWFTLPIDADFFEERLKVTMDSEDYRIIEKELPFADEVKEDTIAGHLNNLYTLFTELPSNLQEDCEELLCFYTSLEELHTQRNEITQILLNIIESNQQAIITLTDNGRGILPEKIPHIFERMYQCDDSRSSKGNGLGLSIAKELVNAHKGTINVASTPNFETTFTITLPKAL